MPVDRTKPSTTAVVIVDVQEKLVPVMPPEAMEQLVRSARILVNAAMELGAPVLATEQYPRGLGPTIGPIRELLDAADVTPFAKQTFSACNDPAFVEAVKETDADSAIVIGMETHICVFQTVRDLVARGMQVDVPIDGVASRREDHRQIGLELCAAAGATRTTSETILFDWLVQAGTDSFKKLSRLVR